MKIEIWSLSRGGFVVLRKNEGCPEESFYVADLYELFCALNGLQGQTLGLIRYGECQASATSES